MAWTINTFGAIAGLGAAMAFSGASDAINDDFMTVNSLTYEAGIVTFRRTVHKDTEALALVTVVSDAGGGEPICQGAMISPYTKGETEEKRWDLSDFTFDPTCTLKVDLSLGPFVAFVRWEPIDGSRPVVAKLRIEKESG